MPIVDPFDKPSKPTPRAVSRDLDTRLKVEALRDKPLDRAAKSANIAVDAANLAKAPIDRARAGVALDVDEATKDAQIRKALAEANNAELTTKFNELKAKYPDLKGEQALAGARVALMEEGEKAYRSAKHYDPSTLRNLAASSIGVIPGIGPTASTFMRDQDSQLATAGVQQFTEGATRSLTGAGLRGDERTFTASDFYPLPFEGPKVKAQKQALRDKYLKQMIAAAGPAYMGGDTATTSSVPGAPKVGAVVKGYRYKGGAPDRQESWEKVSP